MNVKWKKNLISIGETLKGEHDVTDCYIVGSLIQAEVREALLCWHLWICEGWGVGSKVDRGDEKHIWIL